MGARDVAEGLVVAILLLIGFMWQLFISVVVLFIVAAVAFSAAAGLLSVTWQTITK